MINKNLIKIANCKSAIQAIHLDLFRCGFELEYQNELDEERDDEAIGEAIDDDFSVSHLINYYFDKDTEGLLSFFWERNIHPESVPYLIKNDALKRELENEIDGAISRYRESIEESLDLHEYTQKLPDLSYFARNNLEFGEDASVSGGEIRTEGALKPSAFIKIAKELFDQDLDIDSKCSFHIHLSAKGINHQYGKDFQASIYYYLLKNIKRWPKELIARFENKSHANQYFPFKLDFGKYCAVAHRGSTWEFRLFGNIFNANSALRCLLLAIESMIFAYDQKRKDYRVLSQNSGLFDFLKQDEYFSLIERAEDLEKILKQYRSNDKRQAN